MRDKKSLFFKLLGFVLAFPIFLTPNLSVFKGGSFDGEFAFPISFVVVFFVGLFLILTAANRLPLKLLGLYFLAFVGFFVTLPMGWFEGSALYVLYFVPMVFSISAGYFSSPDKNSICQFQRWFGFSAAFAALLHISSSVNEFGWLGAFANRGSDSIFGIFSIYQKFVYYATIISFGFLFVLKSGKGIFRVILCLFLLIDVLITGSREALILIVFFVMCHLMGGGRGFIPRIFLFSFLFLIAAFVFWVCWYLFEYDLGRLVFLSKIYQLIESGDLTAGRLDTISYVYGLISLDIPFVFFGTFFQSKLIEFGAPHNQYLEWHFRGGILFLWMNLVILFYAVIAAKKFRHDFAGAIYLLLLAVIFISNNINTPFRAPYASIPIWFVVGILFSLKKSSESFNEADTSKYGKWRNVD